MAKEPQITVIEFPKELSKLLDSELQRCHSLLANTDTDVDTKKWASNRIEAIQNALMQMSTGKPIRIEDLASDAG
jgi:hypothetical protein